MMDAKVELEDVLPDEETGTFTFNFRLTLETFYGSSRTFPWPVVLKSGRPLGPLPLPANSPRHQAALALLQTELGLAQQAIQRVSFYERARVQHFRAAIDQEELDRWLAAPGKH